MPPPSLYKQEPAHRWHPNRTRLCMGKWDVNTDAPAFGKQTHPQIPAVCFQYTLIRAGASEWSVTQIGYLARLTPLVGVSGCDSFAIDPTPLELGGIQEGHQSDSKTSDTRCHVNLPIPRRARNTLFQWMCAPLGKTRKLVGPWL
jgi:hypothetical protein